MKYQPKQILIARKENRYPERFTAGNRYTIAASGHHPAHPEDIIVVGNNDINVLFKESQGDDNIQDNFFTEAEYEEYRFAQSVHATLQDLRIAKNEYEDRITTLIKQFEEKYGVRCSLNITRLKIASCMPPTIVKVELEVIV